MMEIDRKQNIYFIHKVDGEIHWHNVAWGSCGYYGPGHVKALLLSESEIRDGACDLTVRIEQDDFHVIFGAALGIYRIIEKTQTETTGELLMRTSIEGMVSAKFFKNITMEQFNAIVKHYEGLGE